MLQVLVGSSTLEVWVLSPDLFLVALAVHRVVLPLESLAGQSLPALPVFPPLCRPHGPQLPLDGLLDQGALLVSPVLPGSQGAPGLYGLHISGLGAAGGLAGGVGPGEGREGPGQVARGGVGGLPHQHPVVTVVRAGLADRLRASGWRGRRLEDSVLASLFFSSPDVGRQSRKHFVARLAGWLGLRRFLDSFLFGGCFDRFYWWLGLILIMFRLVSLLDQLFGLILYTCKTCNFDSISFVSLLRSLYSTVKLRKSC